ncbi:MAG: tetratricopeptide repeat protein [Desulfuromonadales bacterium]
MPRNIFRVFFSSTFGDFQAEREKLRAEIWPKFEKLCASKGASFNVVDLRWGIAPNVANSHDTIQICLDEVKRCQELSPIPKPNFLMMIGDRYGWRPPAVQIPDDEFQLIQKHVTDVDATLLRDWYQQDTNAVPPIWCMKPREGENTDYAVWGVIEKSLVNILHTVAEKLGPSTALRAGLDPEKYLYSATHMEIADGLLKLEGLQDHIFSFNRELSNLPESAPDVITGRFADYLPKGGRDPEAQTQLEQLKEQVRNALPAGQVHCYQADWLDKNRVTISTGAGKEAQVPGSHLDKFCSDIRTALLSVIEPELELIKATTPLEEELDGQKLFLKETGSILIGRDRELEQIHAYLAEARQPWPLIIQAIGGCGKSALMANAILQIPLGPLLQSGKQENHDDIASHFAKSDTLGFLVYRFIGAAPRSWQPTTFLEDLITQIAQMYGKETPKMPEGVKELAELFHLQLFLATAEQPLTIFIDAIDQFSATAPVQYKDIFPWRLPEHVKMVVSVLDGTDAEQMHSVYPEAHRIELAPLSPDVCGMILDSLVSPRILISEQRNSILDKAKSSGLPLWLVLAAPIARKLASWDTAPDLPADIKELARYVIKRIGDKHGHAITIASLRYIRLARYGLSETEIQEILWRDPEVKAEFDKNKNPDQPPVTDLPPIFWSRLYAELDPYINEYWMDGQLLHRYFHRVFGEVADEMDEETRRTLHIRLAEYFKSQPLMLDQPTSYGDVEEPEYGDNDEERPNGRKLMELPWHWKMAEKWEMLKEIVSDIPFFCELYDRDKYDLLQYWLALNGRYEPGASYLASYETWVAVECPDEEQCNPVSGMIASFLQSECAEYEVAESFIRRTLLFYEKFMGPDHPDTALCISGLSSLLQDRGDYDAAEPLCRRALAIREKVFGAEHPDTADSLNDLAGILKDKGDYDGAELLCRHALAIREKVLGSEHPDTATSLNNLALLLSAKGDYDGAESFFRRSLAITEKVLGTEHPDTAASLDNLATLLSDKGDYDAAESINRRALAIYEKVLGAEHPNTAGSLNNLAGLLSEKGDYDAAEPLYRRALAISEKVFGLEHPDTAGKINNLAGLLSDKSDYDVAESLYRRALAINEKVLGTEHPDTAASLDNLATLLSDKGDYDAAESINRRALAIYEKVLGAEHPNTAGSLNNLAGLLSEKGDYNAAEPLYRRALAISEKVFGLEHPDTAGKLDNLAILLSEKGDYNGAEPLYRRALAIREKFLGVEHQDTAGSLNNLANLLSEKGDYDVAEQLYRRVLAIYEKVLGPDHPDTSLSLNNLANLISDKGDYDGAEMLYRRALAIRENFLGPNHTDTANSLNNLANLLSEKGDCDGAEPLYRRALAIYEKIFGPEHPDTADSLNNLAILLKNKGDYDGAEQLYRRALAIREKVLGPEHLATADSLNNLAILMSDTDDCDRAAPLLRRALAIREKVLGPEHVDTITNMDDLAIILSDIGDYKAAEQLLRRVLQIREKLFGPEHPDTALSVSNLAIALVEKGDSKSAEPLCCQALALYEKILGPDSKKAINLLINFVKTKKDKNTGISLLPRFSDPTSLDLSECKTLTDLSMLSGLVNLSSLCLDDCKNLSDILTLSELTNLTSLSFCNCKRLKDISPLFGLKKLTRLDLEGCKPAIHKQAEYLSEILPECSICFE